jgi:hypothetical protein
VVAAAAVVRTRELWKKTTSIFIYLFIYLLVKCSCVATETHNTTITCMSVCYTVI